MGGVKVDTSTSIQTGNGTLIVVARVTGPSWGYSQSSQEALLTQASLRRLLFLLGRGPAVTLSFPVRPHT